jgi:hypothetical protein
MDMEEDPVWGQTVKERKREEGGRREEKGKRWTYQVS